MTKEKTCAERIEERCTGRMEDISALWKSYQSGEDEHPELGAFHDYGLCFDYVDGDGPGFWRWQFSWGGPSEEIRFYANHPAGNCYRIDYVFQDWFDGAEKAMEGDALETLTEIWEHFQETGTTEQAFNESQC